MQSQTSDGPGVIERLEKLERQNRRMKQAGAVAMILAAAVVLMGQAPATRTVEANEFVLKDTSGIVRGQWGITANGTYQIFNDVPANNASFFLLSRMTQAWV